MRVAVIGSRPEYRDGFTPAHARRDDMRKAAIKAYVDSLAQDDIVISGGAHGADTWAQDAAYADGLICGVFEAVWTRPDGRTDRGAGHKRNAVIADIADRCVAFFGAGASTGTTHCVGLFKAAKKPVEVWRFDDRGVYRVVETWGTREDGSYGRTDADGQGSYRGELFR